MKKVSRLIASSLVLMITLSVPSYGWDALGHMAVAFVAYQQLKPEVKKRVDALLKKNPEHDVWLSEIPANASEADKQMMVFMIAATWPDRLRSKKLHPEIHDDGSRPTGPDADRNTGFDDKNLHRYWHFVDKPFSPDGTTTEDPPDINAKTRIKLFRSVLASNKSDELKSYDLAWLLHLVGDVHQPLHCTSRFTKTKKQGDNGGNGVTLCATASCNTKLHGFWDDALGTSGRATAAIIVGRKLPTARAQEAANLDVEQWIQDSFEKARDIAYSNPPIGNGSGPFKVTKKYRLAVGSLAEKRVALAGARLANILNNELR
ncbi:MAG TPA: S1/P1 nuclease [Blastocatellia bacterium]|nr:S1/P1 nuclease [Blastocatellia bacterium]